MGVGIGDGVGRGFLLCFRLCLAYLSIIGVAPSPWAGWLCGSRCSLSSQGVWGRGGGLPSLFTFMFHIFVHYFNIHLPLGWLSGSRSLNSEGRVLSHMFSIKF